MKILVITIWYILLVAAAPAAGQLVSPITVIPARVGDQTPAASGAIDGEHQVEPATEYTEEQMKEWEAEAMHDYRVRYCHELAKRMGYHHFNMRLYIECEFEEETIRIRND